MTLIDDILEKCKISDVISRHTNLVQKGSNKSGLCPFHKEKTPSFSVSDEKGLYHCFGCGESGNVISFVSKINNVSKGDAVKFLAESAGIDIRKYDAAYKNSPSSISSGNYSTNYSANSGESANSTLRAKVEQKYPTKKRISELLVEASKWFATRLISPSGEEARLYLKKRNITPDLIRKFSVGWCNYGVLRSYLKSCGFSDLEIAFSGLFMIYNNSRDEDSYGNSSYNNSHDYNDWTSPRNHLNESDSRQPNMDITRHLLSIDKDHTKIEKFISIIEKSSNEKSLSENSSGNSGNSNVHSTREITEAAESDSALSDRETNTDVTHDRDNVDLNKMSTSQVSFIDRFGGRIIIPITNEQGEIIGFGGRSLEQRKSKYINSIESPFFLKREILYGYSSAAKMDKSLPLVIVEGYFDVMSLQNTEKFRAVAPLGTALTEKQIYKSWNLDSTPIVLFDGDEAGKKASLLAMERAFKCLKPNYSLKFAFLPTGVDPDDMAQSNQLDLLEKILNNAIPLEEYMWQFSKDSVMSMNSSSYLSYRTKIPPEKRAGLYRKCMNYIQTIKDELIREYYVESLQSRMEELNERSGMGRPYKNYDRNQNEGDRNRAGKYGDRQYGSGRYGDRERTWNRNDRNDRAGRSDRGERGDRNYRNNRDDRNGRAGRSDFRSDMSNSSSDASKISRISNSNYISRNTPLKAVFHVLMKNENIVDDVCEPLSKVDIHDRGLSELCSTILSKKKDFSKLPENLVKDVLSEKTYMHIPKHTNDEDKVKFVLDTINTYAFKNSSKQHSQTIKKNRTGIDGNSWNKMKSFRKEAMQQKDKSQS